MAVYNQQQGFQSVLNATLGEYHAKGFRLLERQGHAVLLYYRDERVGIFSATMMTARDVQAVCRDHLEKHNVLST